MVGHACCTDMDACCLPYDRTITLPSSASVSRTLCVSADELRLLTSEMITDYSVAMGSYTNQCREPW